MSLLRRTFRRWWQVPRRASEPIDHRTVSFLELFYDLVYVMLIAEVAHVLAGHADLAGLGRFVFLFLIIWWAWLNGTLYPASWLVYSASPLWRRSRSCSSWWR